MVARANQRTQIAYQRLPHAYITTLCPGNYHKNCHENTTPCNGNPRPRCKVYQHITPIISYNLDPIFSATDCSTTSVIMRTFSSSRRRPTSCKLTGMPWTASAESITR